MREITDPALRNELETRGIGFEKNGRYYVSTLEAAYLTELGKANFEDALRKVESDDALRVRYAVLKDLRSKMRVANYVENDDIFLVYDKGMVPKRAESVFVVKVMSGKESANEVAELTKMARSVRKAFVMAFVDGERIEYYKVGGLEM